MSKIPLICREYESEILGAWTQAQIGSMTNAALSDADLRGQCREFLNLFQSALQTGNTNVQVGNDWAKVREFLAGISRTRAQQGFSPSETALFVFSLKPPIFERLKTEIGSDSDTLFKEIGAATDMLDRLGLYTTTIYQKSREDVISRQQEEMLELSTPVVKLWDGILGLPMIGTLDSNRTQVVMEALLQRIVETGAEVAIIDITGVPTVDTLVAQHLMKTVAAARLMGADCIISGIRPQIAQTIVHLALDLGSIVTKSTLADAFAVALERRGLTVAPLKQRRVLADTMPLTQ